MWSKAKGVLFGDSNRGLVFILAALYNSLVLLVSVAVVSWKVGEHVTRGVAQVTSSAVHTLDTALQKMERERQERAEAAERQLQDADRLAREQRQQLALLAEQQRALEKKAADDALAEQQRRVSEQERKRVTQEAAEAAEKARVAENERQLQELATSHTVAQGEFLLSIAGWDPYLACAMLSAVGSDSRSKITSRRVRSSRFRRQKDLDGVGQAV